MDTNQFFDLKQYALWPVCFVVVITLLYFFRLKQKRKIKETPGIILQRKFFKGQMNSKEYERQKEILEKDEDMKLKAFFLSRM